jgi:hypothetical protein
MASLSPEKNPILRVYEFFQDPGLRRIDTAEYFGFANLKLRTITSIRAAELIYALRRIPGALSQCRLTLAGTRLIDFSQASVNEWLDRIRIEEFDDQTLCDDCRLILNSVLDGLEAYGAGASWPGEDPEQDTLRVLDRLADCQRCGESFEFEIRVDKHVLIDNFLLDTHENLKDQLCALLWFDSESFQKAFTSFSSLLKFISNKRQPVVLFLYQSAKIYQGDFLKILSLTEPDSSAGEREKKLAENLDAFTVQIFDDYKTVLLKYSSELRPEERPDLPVPLIIQCSDQLAEYPDHPLFMDGPLRAIAVYAIMAWLAETSSLSEGVAHFHFGSDAFSLQLKFSLTDVWRDQKSIFETESDWRTITGLVAREIGSSIGSEHLRNHWRAVLKERTEQDFEAAKFFKTLKALHDDFRSLKEAPVELGRTSPRLIEILVRIDTENKQLTFELNGPGYFHQPVGEIPLKNVSRSALRNEELSKLARTHLSRILEPDVNDPELLVPSVGKLKAEGVELWRKFIPQELRQAYADLRDQDLTIFIVSEDPSFPWELVKPFALKKKNKPGFTDMWWAVKFSIARWLSGFNPPADDFALKQVCCVADHKLEAAIKERDYLQSMATVCHLPQTKNELTTYLETNDYDVIHFACHGKFATENPGDSVALLPDGYRLTPTDLSTPDIMQKLADNRPLVFLNSCHSGRTGNTLLGIEGWATQFIDLQCGAFIGCGWEVTDKFAAEFATTFYKKFQGGESLGNAVHLARAKVKRLAAENSTWLAYYLYGNPNAELRK